MNREESEYLRLLHQLSRFGEKRESRSGTTLSSFGQTLRFDMSGWRVPILTTKKMFLKGIVEELLFFIRGETDTKKLEEKGVNIWKGNTSREFLDKRGLENYAEGQMGPMYGFAWRHFGALAHVSKHGLAIDKQGIDQLAEALRLLKEDPTSRRIMITAYDPKASKWSALDPCHLFFQFYVSEGKLSCQFVMRSTDVFLGLPFNIASYAILTHLMARASGLEPGELIFVGGDVHLYETHLTAAEEQMGRKPNDFPILKIEKQISTIEDIEALEFEDFVFENYQYHPAIKAEMSA